MAEAAADTDRDHAFGFGLERILDGLQTLIEAPEKAQHRKPK